MIIVLTGPPAAGKTTTAEKLAVKFPKSVHIANDNIRHLIKGGYHKPWNPEAREQIKLSEKVIIEMAKLYLKNGYVVILDGVHQENNLRDYRKAFPKQKIYCFMLMADLKTLLARDKKRGSGIAHRVKHWHKVFSEKEGVEFIKMQTKNRDTDQIVKEILRIAKDYRKA